MKKIIIIFCLFFTSFSSIFIANAEGENSSDTVKIKTNTKIPWWNCTTEDNWKTYTCQVPKDSKAIIKTFWEIIKYFTFIALISWVLFMVINWIMYSMWWLDQDLKESAKKRIIQTLFWLIILLSSWYILQTVAPWFFK